MEDNNNKIPSPTEVRQIMNDTYNVFYRKWTNPNTVYDPAVMMQEVHELNRKYDCDLCRNMLTDLIISIEEEWRNRNAISRN